MRRSERFARKESAHTPARKMLHMLFACKENPTNTIKSYNKFVLFFSFFLRWNEHVKCVALPQIILCLKKQIQHFALIYIHSAEWKSLKSFKIHMELLCDVGICLAGDSFFVFAWRKKMFSISDRLFVDLKNILRILRDRFRITSQIKRQSKNSRFWLQITSYVMFRVGGISSNLISFHSVLCVGIDSSEIFVVKNLSEIWNVYIISSCVNKNNCQHLKCLHSYQLIFLFLGGEKFESFLVWCERE